LRPTVGRGRLGEGLRAADVRGGWAWADGRERLRRPVGRDRLRAAVGGNGCARGLRQAVKPAVGPDR
jgi:hypothetical protein